MKTVNCCVWYLWIWVCGIKKKEWLSDCTFHETLILKGWAKAESRNLQEREGGGREIFRGTKEGLGRRGKRKAQTDFCPRDPQI